MSQTQSDPSQPNSPPTPVDDDPLAHLHKMSTTAGLGSGDYVAVNGAAVFALLLGLASALALFDRMLLVIPLAAVVIGIVALFQIRESNRTQTGMGLVALGLALALLFGGIVTTLWATEGLRTREDQRAIAQVISQLGATVKDSKYEQTYKLFSDRFKEGVSPQAFNDQIKFLNESAVYGKLKDARTGLMQFQTDEATGARYAIVRVQIDFEKIDRPLSDDFTMKKERDQWRIERFPSLFGSGARERDAQAQ